MGVLNLNLRGHTKVWEPLLPIQGAILKRRTPEPQLNGAHGGMGLLNRNSRGHTEEWES